MEEPKTLQEAVVYFSDPDRCISYLVARRWPDGVSCPTCGRADVSYIPKRRLWQCKTRHPKCQFSVKVGTVLEESAISLDKWLMGMWMIANCKNGVSSHEIARSLSITQKSAWFLLHRVRLAMKDDRTFKFGGIDAGPVESDETFIGPNPKRMHKSRKVKLQVQATARDCYVGKTAVFGVLDRELRQVRANVIPNVKRETLQNEILNQVHPGSKLYTDAASSYDRLHKEFVHEVVNHAKEYVNGQVHTQGLDNFWSLLKRTLRGTYVSVEPFHLDRYVDEQVFRFNNRRTPDNPLDDADRFAIVASRIVGRRITYAELTGKTGEARPF